MRIAAAIRAILAHECPGLAWAPPENPDHRSGMSGGDHFRHDDPPCFGRYADYEGDPYTVASWQTSDRGTRWRTVGRGRCAGGIAPRATDCDGPETP